MRWVFLLTVVAVLGSTGVADAQASGSGPDPQALEEAKARYKEGNKLLKAGKHDEALDLFLASRALVPSVQNTVNAAFCLDKLGRYDEALDFYDEVRVKFPDELTEDLFGRIQPEITRLRELTGAIEVTADEGSSVSVDERARGVLPLVRPVPVMPGAHTVHIEKDGYQPFETSVQVNAAETVTVRGTLERVPVAAETVRGDAAAVRRSDIDKERSDGVLDKWWFWTAVGAGVAGAVAVVLVATHQPAPKAYVEGDVPIVMALEVAR